MRIALWLCLVPGSGVGVLAARAQAPDTVVHAREVLARFQDARALAVDTRGFLYVADAGRDVVDKLAPDGTRLAPIGGSGSEHGQFDAPSDVDPTNGLVVVVADMGNGRLQRFSGASLHMETLPVARAEDFLVPAQGLERYAGDGQPMAVATSPSSEIFALERLDGVVLKWDAWRRPERIIGAFGSAGAYLTEPVALAVDENRLLVADAAREEVLVFDHFGGFVGTLAERLARNTRAMFVQDGGLWLVRPDAVTVHSAGGAGVRTLRMDIGEDLVDARPYGGNLYLLTPTRLLRAAM